MRALQDCFPARNVFRDINYRSGIQPGEDFARRIESELARADVVLALIGDTWAQDFNKRASETGVDYVRKELEIALALEKPILPVLVEEAAMPVPATLPPGLEPIATLQGLRLTDERFDAEISAIVRALHRILAIPDDEEAAVSTIDKKLLEAASKGALKSLKRLVSQGANLEARNDEGATPLILAAATGHARAVSALCELGADIDATTSHGISALVAAVMKGAPPLVLRALLDAGADVDLATDDGSTALLWACNQGDYDSVTMLLDHGANPKVANEQGAEPLASWIVAAPRKLGGEQNLIEEIACRLANMRAVKS